MTIENLIITLIVAVLAGLSGFLIATSKTKKDIVQREEELTSSKATIERIEQENQVLRTVDKELQNKIRNTELSLQQVTTSSEALKDRKHELEQGLNTANEKLERIAAAHHSSEKEKQSAETELQALRSQMGELNERVKTSISDLKVERESLNKQQILNAELGKRCKGFEVTANETQLKARDLQTRIDTVDKKYEALQAVHQNLHSEYTELKTSLEEREEGHAKQLKQFEEQKAALSEQFKVLANDILETKTKALQESSKLSLSAVMSPFQQSIEGFKKEVQEIHNRETSQRGELRKELETLKELNHKITTEAHELSTALRGQKKLQGNWGELVLENVLDRSGLQLGKDYKREVSITTEEGRQRPDAVVYLPQNKHLIIDAKVSLNAYTRFVNTEDEAERTIALNEHVKAMGDRIKELADRDYYKLPGLNSPEMVFMFVPIESAFVEALKADETLFQSAIENNVLVATPTTLLTSLNIVRQLWRYEDQNKHTAALAHKAELVFKKLNAFLASFEGIKKGLDKATEAYGKAEAQLVSGRGNLVKQVCEFKSLAPAIKAELPSYFTDKAELEIDFIPAEEQLSDNAEVIVLEGGVIEPESA
ncbi:MAG: DNA recombination protein RmuC [Oceanospirillales bacterium]|nr:DNA recombination protein RmuC [Oceanospirillales bacterium]